MTDAPRPKGYEELLEGAALVASWRCDELELAGADRVRFLNGLLTCDLRDLEPGSGRYGFATSAKGRVLADVAVAALEERLLLGLPAGSAPEVRSHLERYRVADRVEVESAEAGRRTVVAGPGARSMLASLVGDLPETWGVESGPGWRAVSDPRLGVPAWRLLTSERTGAEVERALAAAQLPVAAPEAVTALRVEAGLSWFGIDFGPENLPQETGLEEQAVCYEKGCYLGQEVVARIHYRGRPARQLRGFMAAGTQLLAAGAELVADGAPVGCLTTATFSPRLGRPVALGMLHRSAEERDKVELADGTELVVVELPFVARTGSL